MEDNRNNVLLTVIGVATLLVALVGASFAYFTATSTPTAEQSVQTGELKIAASLSREVSSLIKPTDYSQDGAEANDDVAKLKLTVNGTGTTVTDAKYYLTMLGSVTKADGSAIDTTKGGEKSEIKWVLVNTTNTTIANGEVIASGDFSTLTADLPGSVIKKSGSAYLANLSGTTEDEYTLLVYIEESGNVQDNLSEVKISASMTAKALTPKTDGTYATPAA